jgi:hypothetical protein
MSFFEPCTVESANRQAAMGMVGTQDEPGGDKRRSHAATRALWPSLMPACQCRSFHRGPLPQQINIISA